MGGGISNDHVSLNLMGRINDQVNSIHLMGRVDDQVSTNLNFQQNGENLITMLA